MSTAIVPSIWRRVLVAVPEDQTVAVRGVRRAVAGVRADYARNLLYLFKQHGLVTEPVPGQFRRTVPLKRVYDAPNFYALVGQTHG